METFKKKFTPEDPENNEFDETEIEAELTEQFDDILGVVSPQTERTRLVRDIITELESRDILPVNQIIEGPPGPTGMAGPQGPQGLIGEQGPSGLQGERGHQGPMGQPGPQGDQGIQGEQGVPGERGPAGPQGPTGVPDVREIKEQIQGDLEKQFSDYKVLVNRSLASQGGGGSTRILDNDDVEFNRPSQLANNDILIFNAGTEKFRALNLVDVINTIKVELEVQFDRLVDERAPVGDVTYTYIGEAAPGSAPSAAAWRIKRVSENSATGITEIIWAGDSDAQDKVWNDRETYDYTA
jgi:hypothetical protein